MMTRLFKILFPLSLVLGLTLACGLGGGGEEAPPPTDAPSGGAEALPPTEAPSGGAEALPPTEAPAGSEETEEEFSLSSVTSGLESLDSYRGYFKMTFDGTTGGEAEHATYEMNTEYVRDPFAQRIVMQVADTEEDFEIVYIGDKQYILFGEGQCMSTSAEESDAMDMEIFAPEDVIGGLENARRVWPDEQVNGILCSHYTFDETGVAWAGFAHAEGEVWVAVDGDYVVRYILEADGKDPATEDEGHIEWEYEISDVNVPITIEPPPGCEITESEFPIMSDATDMTTMGGMTMYTSASPLDDVLAFYQEQMEANGWSDTGDTFITSDTAMLSYTKDERVVTIALSTEDGAVSVIIMSE
ncbi:MAG: hypothetical protein SWK90_04165 [Chloroflexota bacterium]|nr:hypothetical protein [Chloroflexota bacterium]